MNEHFPPVTPLPFDDTELLLEQICDSYEDDLSNAPDSSFESYLEQIDNAFLPSLFQELLVLRLAYPTSDGTRASLGRYLKDYPHFEDIVLNVFAKYHNSSPTVTPTLFSLHSPKEETVDDLDNIQHIHQLGKYPVIGHLKSGGQGDVFLARHPTLGKIVVIKVLKRRVESDSSKQNRLIREGRILANASHANIVQIHDLDFHDGRPFLVMEFVEGPTLSTYLQNHTITRNTALKWVSAITASLQELHNQHIVHRDITPNNILICEGQPVLIDFGLALDATDGEGDCQKGIAGTLPYMAPEQVRVHDQPITPATDVFALGGLLLYLITGKGIHRLINDENDILSHHVSQYADSALDAVLPNDVFKAVLLNCLVTDPQQRYQTSSDLLTALQAIDTPAGVLTRRNAFIATISTGFAALTYSLFNREQPPSLEEIHYLPPLEGDFILVFKLTDQKNSQYLHSFENAILKTEEGLGVAKYWMPETANVEATVTYRFLIPFEIGEATLTIRSHVFTKAKFNERFADSASVILEASTDGIYWQQFKSHQHTDPEHAANGPYDISPMVAGGNEIYIRARMLTDTNWPGVGPIYAQFLRTPFHEQDDQTNCFRLSVTACGE